MFVSVNNPTGSVGGRELASALDGLLNWNVDYAATLINNTGFGEALFPTYAEPAVPVIQAALNTKRTERGGENGYTIYREHEVIALCSALYGGNKINTQNLAPLYSSLSEYTNGWMYYRNGEFWIQNPPMPGTENVACMDSAGATYRFSTFTSGGDGQSTIFDLTIAVTNSSPFGFTVSSTSPVSFAYWYSDPPEFYPYEEW